MNKFEILQNKIVTKEALKPILNVAKFKCQTVVFSNGCFDIIHRGHIEYLAKAASLGHMLVVGLNTDASVRKLKGESRPLQDENSRALVLAALRFIDFVVLFDEETPYNLISHIMPDILVKGSDYKEDEIVGAGLVKQNGGKVVTIDLVQGHSTTAIINRIK
jgi:D-glycero-beta-D-manno-heptose 1-phosphate adenylyltransferase